MYPKHDFYQRQGYHHYAPTEIKDLHFDLKRSHLYPRRPDLIADAIVEGPMPHHTTAYMPQKMGFRRWKNPHTGASWDYQATSAVRAAEYSQAKIASTGARHFPPNSSAPRFTANSRHFVRLPQPSDNINPYIDQVPRGYGIPAPPSISVDALDDFARQLSTSLDVANVKKINARDRALGEVQTAMYAMRGLSLGQASPDDDAAMDAVNLFASKTPGYTGENAAKQSAAADINQIRQNATTPTVPSAGTQLTLPTTSGVPTWVWYAAGAAVVVGGVWLFLKR